MSIIEIEVGSQVGPEAALLWRRTRREPGSRRPPRTESKSRARKSNGYGRIGRYAALVFDVSAPQDRT
eukprot:1162456-Rhodomonas_salina.4